MPTPIICLGRNKYKFFLSSVCALHNVNREGMTIFKVKIEIIVFFLQFSINMGEHITSQRLCLATKLEYFQFFFFSFFKFKSTRVSPSMTQLQQSV